MVPFLHVVPMDVGQQASFQVRAEERYRIGNDVHATESELNPLVRYDLIWDGGNTHAVALYQPRLVYTQVSDRTVPDKLQVNPETLNLSDPNEHPISFLHNGGLGIEVVKPRWRLTAYQFAAYGDVTTTALLVPKPWLGGDPPDDPTVIIPSTVAARFTLLFAQTQIAVPLRLSRRAALIPFFTYNAFGGADSASRGAMALTSGPGASLSLDLAATKNDRFVSTIGGGVIDTRFEGDRAAATVYRAEATQSWKHWYNARLSTEVLGGGTIGGDNINGFAIYSIAQVAMLYDTWIQPRIEPGAPLLGGAVGTGDRVQLGIIVKATPWLDIFSGGLEQRALGTFAMNYYTGRLTLRGSVSAARVFNNPETVARYSFFNAEAGFRYGFGQTFSVDGGVRYGSQDFSNAIRFSDITQATVFAGLTWAPLPARL